MNRRWGIGAGFVFAAVVVVMFGLGQGDASAGKIKYVEGEFVNGGSISGVVKYKGPLKDVRIDLMKEKNGETCSKHPEAKDGVRFDRKILRSDDFLQNAVVFIENIERGKAWGKRSVSVEGEESGFTNFHFKNCDISPKITIVRKTSRGETAGNLTVTTHDGGVLHNPLDIWWQVPVERSCSINRYLLRF